MSTSPLPPDPYEALGLSRDCDTDAVKKAHRKLVLKHHPDRIKDPALVEQNQHEFTKVQQAYELLADPARRRRYDDECRLAQLRRERMSERMNDSAPPPRPTYTRTTYTARPSPAPTNPVQREYQPESRYAYEERVPDSPYVESTSRGFPDDSIPRGTSRKVNPKEDISERRTSAAKVSERKEKPKPSHWEREKPQAPMSVRSVFGIAGMASGLAKAQQAKSREKEMKEKEREVREKNAKARDKEERRDRDAKNNNSRQPTAAYVQDYSDSEESSDSESETIVAQGRSRRRGPSPLPRTRNSLTPEPPQSKRQVSPMSEVRVPLQQSPRPIQRSTRRLSPGPAPKTTRQPSPRPDTKSSRQPSPRDQRSVYDDEDSQDDEKHKHHYRNAQDYIFTAQRKDPRPPLSRQVSGIHDTYSYRESERDRDRDRDRDRKSGSDNERKHSSSTQKSSRRSMPAEDPKVRPSLFPQSSAPAGVRGMTGTESRDPFAAQRTRGDSYLSNSHRREMPPELKRSPSEPVPHKLQAKRDSVPIKGSSLKQTESMQNQDSGYGSSSNPQTPETRGESPHRDIRSSRESRPREASSTTKYAVRKDEDALRARKMAAEEGPPLTRYLSPQDQPHHHRHHHNPESRERHASRSRERDVRGSEARHRSSSNRPAHPERQSSYRNEPSSRHEERDSSRSIRRERSPDGRRRPGPNDQSYFRKWDGPTQESRTKPASFQAPHTPTYSNKLYGEASPRSTYTHRRPSLYAS